MTMVQRGTKAPARWRLLLCGLLLLTGCRIEPLTPDPGVDLPVPKGYSFSGLNDTTMIAVEAPLRRELDARVPAKLSDVLVFYRTELGKRGWQEKPDGAVVGADHVQIAFAAPKGEAKLKLDRKDGGTTINLVQRDRDAATEAHVVPKSGRATLLLGNLMRDNEAVFTVNQQTIKLAAHVGTEPPKSPMLDLPPGKYPYSLQVAGRPDHNATIELAADEAWGLTVFRDGVVEPLHLY
jgi:hypothetical protein